MSHSSSSPDPPGLREKIEAGIDRVSPTSDEPTGQSLTDAASELLDVFEQIDALLRTIDLDQLPDAVDFDALPDLVDFERIMDAIRERDPDVGLDLSNLEGVVDTRELWNLVDLLEFAKTKQRLDRELEDVVGDDAKVGADSEAAADVKAFASSLGSEAKQPLVQQEAKAAVEVARDAVVEQHATIARVYTSNKERFGKSRGAERNSTSVSLLPAGPLPDSVSTRLSTIPSRIPYTEIDPIHRIYGRRWKEAGSKRGR